MLRMQSDVSVYWRAAEAYEEYSFDERERISLLVQRVRPSIQKKEVTQLPHGRARR